MLISTFIATAVAVVTSSNMTLPVRPDAEFVIFESSGIATADAKASAKQTKETVRNWCENNRPGDNMDECVKSNFDETVYSAAANCQSGTITDVDGSKYQYLGKEKDKTWLYYPTFKDSKGKKVVMSYAGGGIGLAATWWTLCPNVTPYDVQPLKTEFKKSDFSKDVKTATLDGQKVTIDYGNGVIVNADNKLYFRGIISKDGPVVGMIYTHKDGCDPIAALVEGHTNVDNKRKKIITFLATEPKIDGCKVVGHTDNVELEIKLR